jgi:nitrogen fixation NifU-like protein
MRSPELLDHFANPRNTGELPPPAVTLEVSNPACGDILRLSVLITDGRIVEARYKARGCAAAIAAGSALTELIQNGSPDDLRRMSASDVERALGGLSAESGHAAVLAADAIKALLNRWPDLK